MSAAELRLQPVVAPRIWQLFRRRLCSIAMASGESHGELWEPMQPRCSPPPAARGGPDMSTSTTDALQRAIDYLDATGVAPERYTYRDDATHRYYIVTEADLETLPSYLDGEDGTLGHGGYGEWCADTRAVEMPTWWTPDERTRYGWEHVDDDGVDWGDPLAAEADYQIDLEDEDPVYMSADLSQASAPLRVGYADGDEPSGIRWESTPYQTADARHDMLAAAEIVVRYTDTESIVVSCVPSRSMTADLETGEEDQA